MKNIQSRKIWLRSIVVLLVMALVLLSACSASTKNTADTNSENSSNISDTVSTDSAGADEGNEATEATEADVAEEGEKLADEQVLNLIYIDLSTLDVNDVRNSNEVTVLTALNESLFRTFTAEDGSEVVEYAGCTGYDVSDDGLTYTFHLRDYYWSDGVKVTAQQYVDSWLRLLDPVEAFANAYLATGIAGAAEYNSGEGSKEDVAIQYIDDNTFSVTLSEPDTTFVKKVSWISFSPIRLDLIEAAEAAGKEWGTDYTLHAFSGPFVISNRVLENSMTLTKNENYWNADNVILEQVNLQVVDEASTQAQLLEAKQVDVLTLSDNEYIQSWEPLVQNGTLVHFSINAPSITYLVLDQHPEGNGGSSGLMLNEKCRLAISLAIDREEYNLLFQDGLATPAYGQIPVGIQVGDLDYHALVEDPLAEYQEYLSDPDYLRNLFEEGAKEEGHSGNAEDETITFITVNPNSTTTNILEWYKQQLESKLGVTVQINVMADWTEYYSARDSYNYDIYTMGWLGGFNDPLTFLTSFVTGNGYAKFMGGFTNEEFDSLVAQATVSQDQSERLELLAAAEKLLIQSGGTVPVFFPQRQVYTQSYVKGLSLPLFGAEYELSRVYILEH